jgi:hypothetical protein
MKPVCVCETGVWSGPAGLPLSSLLLPLRACLRVGCSGTYLSSELLKVVVH